MTPEIHIMVDGHPYILHSKHQDEVEWLEDDHTRISFELLESKENLGHLTVEKQRLIRSLDALFISSAALNKRLGFKESK